MAIITVTGEIDREDLGLTLPHEHFLFDPSRRFEDLKIEGKEKEELFRQKVSIDNLSQLKLNVLAVLDNVILEDIDAAIEESLEFKRLGGSTIVDQTSEAAGRDPEKLKYISEKTGLNIICNTGQYIEGLQSGYTGGKNISELADIMIGEISDGIGDSGVRAGSIGEIGSSREISPNEEKVLKASAIAQKETGAPVFIHTWLWGENGRECLDIMEEAGVHLEKAVICHADGNINIPYYKEIISRGSFIEFDLFGQEWGSRDLDTDEWFFLPRDIDRVNAIIEMAEDDPKNLEHILISSDVNLKMNLKRYGGYGYAHIVKNIMPLMVDLGIRQEQVNMLVYDNPKKLLDF
jgi:phosphotriesterase-related protein